ncbi:MAG: glycosyltransferase family 39 protein, partial [Chloroflexota bacterium]|nr:glycosyltransferase family 39 protein [Chloroflexota bacterium]
FSRSPGSPGMMPRLDWFELILMALTAAFFLFAALATLTPESIFTASDSVRQHLPQAREIWQDHAVLFYPYMESFSASVLGASLNAVAYGLGGITTVRILQVLVSLCCLIAIAGLGATLGGRLAGIASAACFSAMPLVLWLTGHAYPDLLAVLFICASVQCAMWWQHDGYRSRLIISGALAGFSLVTKQISALIFVAFLIALAISARPGATIGERFQATLLVAFACLIVTFPWFLRSAILTGTFPLLGTLLAQLNNLSGSGILGGVTPPDATLATPADVIADVAQGGVARSLPGIVRGPWDLTFHGAYASWRSVRYGEFGILLLMFLPLIFLHLCSRGVVLIAITASISFVGWVFTIQVPRHLLPGLALLSVLAGIALAAASSERLNASRIPTGRLVQVAAIAGFALTPLFFLPNTSTFFPITVLTGATSPQDYLARVDPATAALKAATALLPADTPVAYIGEWQGDRTLTEAQLVFLGTYTTDTHYSLDTHVGDSPDLILGNFERAGIRYFIWDRGDTRPQDVETTLLSGDFLLRYTTILGGDNGVYLYAFHPDGVADPRLHENMLEDPAFASLLEPGNVWNGSKRDLSDTGVLEPRRQMPVSQRVEVAPGQPYLLVLEGSCSSPTDQARVSLTWLDANDGVLGATSDTMALGTSTNSALMWRVAPDEAASVDVGISTAAGTPCLVTRIGMYAYGAP